MTINSYSRGIRRLVALSLVALTAGACDQGLTAVNDNPNVPENVPSANILPNAIRTGVNRFMGVGWQLRLTGLWPQIYAEIQYPDEDRYVVRPSAIQTYWDDIYVNALKDLQRIETKEAGEGGNPNYAAIARVMKAWEFASASDVWGYLPYTEALMGDSTGNFQPVYTPQSEIFADIQSKLAAVASMVDSDPVLAVDGAADIIYGGDLDAWVRFANSLRLRYAMQIVNTDPTTAQEQFVAAWNTGNVILDNADNAEMDYLPEFPNTNPWHEDWKTRDDYAMSATFIDTLNALNDPRLTYYAEPTDSGPTYQGMPNGIPNDAPALKAVSRIGNYWRENPNGTFVIMGASEVLLLAAEAAERGWISGSAQDYYERAIAADMTKYEDDASGGYTPFATETEIADYIAQPSVQYAGGAAGLDQIHLQMWITFFGNSNEAYATWRRTGIPALTIAANAKQDAIPVRLPYADLEQSLNGDNWQAAVSAQGLTDGFRTPVWWDAPPN